MTSSPARFQAADLLENGFAGLLHVAHADRADDLHLVEQVLLGPRRQVVEHMVAKPAGRTLESHRQDRHVDFAEEALHLAVVEQCQILEHEQEGSDLLGQLRIRRLQGGEDRIGRGAVHPVEQGHEKWGRRRPPGIDVPVPGSSWFAGRTRGHRRRPMPPSPSGRDALRRRPASLPAGRSGRWPPPRRRDGTARRPRVADARPAGVRRPPRDQGRRGTGRGPTWRRRRWSTGPPGPLDHRSSPPASRGPARRRPPAAVSTPTSPPR